MAEKSLRRRLPAITRKTKATISKHRYSSPSPLLHRNKDCSSRRSFKQGKPILQRCSSEPDLFTDGIFAVCSDFERKFDSDFDLFRPQHSLNVLFSSSSSIMSINPINFEDYNKDAKVVVNVTVEGSPGPIRALVRLGSSVDETIRLIVDKYIKEGRSPKLDISALSSLELHNSYFSLQSLKRTDAMGEVGSRSFYLRKNNSSRSSSNEADGPEMLSSLISEISAVSTSSALARPTQFIFFPACFSRKMSKIIRRTRKLWKILGCI